MNDKARDEASQDATGVEQQDDSATGAGAESPEEGKAAMDAAEDAAIEPE